MERNESASPNSVHARVLLETMHRPAAKHTHESRALKDITKKQRKPGIPPPPPNYIRFLYYKRKLRFSQLYEGLELR